MKVREEDGQYASECVELGGASCGDTIEQAFEAVREATVLYLETLEDEGDRDRVFAERGIRVLVGPPGKVREIPTEVSPREYVSTESLPVTILA